MAENKYIVPDDLRHDFDMLVQRANRRIQSSLRYIQKEGITSDSTHRALLGNYASPTEWHTSKTVFSRGKVFNTEKDFKQYVRHLEQWGKTGDYVRSIENIKEGYYKAIIEALTTTALDNGVLTDEGKLPGDIAEKVRGLTLEQMTNFFEHADPSEEIETQGWASDEYIGVDPGQFTDITTSYINKLQQLFPQKSIVTKVVEKKTTQPRKKKKKTTKKKKRTTRRKKKK